ncbi:MAG TPA: O-antigen ligase family protein [Solirubrobacteraceae bacterium]|jgi:O-antigen ligase|nr:O-antigen ligase family protein [Solirubrobacteraceae bacterium]
MGRARWQALVLVAAVLGLLGGAVAERKPSTAVELCLLVVALVGLAMLGDRGYPWAIMAMVSAPWYQFTAHSESPTGINQKVICTAIAASVLTPWLWSLAFGGRRTRPNRATLLLALLYLGMALLIHSTLGSISAIVTSPVIVGYLFGGISFLCARRFVRIEAWPAAAFAGLCVLLALGAFAYVTAPSERDGYFAGYPITYGALLVGLIPIGLLYAYRRSRSLAVAVGVASIAMLVFSESRSAWIATGAVLLVLVALLGRSRNVRALALVGAALVITLGLVLGTGTLHKVIDERLNTRAVNSQSLTHREWSVGFALGQIGKAPVFGAGAPGFSAEESNNRTSLGALDDGYLSVTLDMGLVGLFAALIPISVALTVLVRCGLGGVTPPLELSLALGIFGMAVVTLFYDSFYWSQIDLLFGSMGGALSLRLGAVGVARVRGRRTGEPRLERSLGLLGSSS